MAELNIPSIAVVNNPVPDVGVPLVCDPDEIGRL